MCMITTTATATVSNNDVWTFLKIAIHLIACFLGFSSLVIFAFTFLKWVWWPLGRSIKQRGRKWFWFLLGMIGGEKRCLVGLREKNGQVGSPHGQKKKVGLRRAKTILRTRSQGWGFPPGETQPAALSPAEGSALVGPPGHTVDISRDRSKRVNREVE